jgi:hypothetical protein
MSIQRFLSASLAALAALSAITAMHAATPPKTLRLYVFDCGVLDIPDTSNYRFKPEELASKNMSVACFLVAHPKGTLMWDTGAVPDRNFKPGGVPATLRYATVRRPLEAELKEVGYSPADINYLAISISTGTTSAIPTCSRAPPGWCVRKSAT